MKTYVLGTPLILTHYDLDTDNSNDSLDPLQVVGTILEEK